jgi:hypothetical protein
VSAGAGTTETPAWSRPPFEEGNLVALRHGARSPRVLQPIVDAVLAEAAVSASWAMRPAFAAELTSWAWAEARCRVLRHWIDEHSLLSEESQQAAGELARAEARAATARDRLGLNPLALARLMTTLDSAPAGTDDDGLAGLKAEGRRIVEARESALAAEAGAEAAQRHESEANDAGVPAEGDGLVTRRAGRQWEPG